MRRLTPCEEAERLEDQTGEPEPDKCRHHDDHEEPYAGDLPAVGDGISARMQRRQQSADGQRSGPDNIRRLDDPSSTQAYDTETKHLTAQHDQYFETG